MLVPCRGDAPKSVTRHARCLPLMSPSVVRAATRCAHVGPRLVADTRIDQAWVGSRSASPCAVLWGVSAGCQRRRVMTIPPGRRRGRYGEAASGSRPSRRERAAASRGHRCASACRRGSQRPARRSTRDRPPPLAARSARRRAWRSDRAARWGRQRRALARSNIPPARMAGGREGEWP